MFMVMFIFNIGCEQEDIHKLSDYKYFDDPTCKGYGAVNYWHTISPSEQADVVAKYGVDVYHIEYFVEEYRKDLNTLKVKYADLLSECRKRKVVLFVSIFNDNSHLSKYDNTPWKPSLEYLNEALNAIIDAGSEGVIVQPVCETKTTLGLRFETLAKVKLDKEGFRTCYNRDSRPRSVRAGWDYAAYHPFTTTEKVPATVVCVTDTGLLLNKLGGFDKFDANRVTEYGTRVLKGWNCPLILYGLLHKEVDEEAIKALGAIK